MFCVRVCIRWEIQWFYLRFVLFLRVYAQLVMRLLACPFAPAGK